MDSCVAKRAKKTSERLGNKRTVDVNLRAGEMNNASTVQSPM